MKRHRDILSRSLAWLMALTVIAGMILPGAGTAEAASQLQVAQYIKTTRGTVAGTAASNHGIYAGQWKASIPMADVMSAFESKMKSEADAGHFPWNIEKVDSSAYIYYDVTFPEGVSVGMPVTASKTNIVPAHTITNSKSGNTVKFKFKLADVNWKTIYDYYKADRASGTSNHTVDVTVPYTVKANSYKEAQDWRPKPLTVPAVSLSIRVREWENGDSVSRPSPPISPDSLWPWISPARMYSLSLRSAI